MPSTPAPPPVQLLDSDAVFTLRHSSSFMLLAAAAGGTNAAAFLLCGTFVTHVSGVATQLAIDFKSLGTVAEAGLVLACFIAGAMGSVLTMQARVAAGRPPRHDVPLYVVGGVLLAVGLAGHLVDLGAGDDEVKQVAALSALAFAMGLMNASVASATALSVRTTHVTGPATDVGVHLGTAFFAPNVDARALRLARLRGGNIAAFCVGAMLMVPVVAGFRSLAFGAAALLVIIAAFRSFTPRVTTAS